MTDVFAEAPEKGEDDCAAYPAFEPRYLRAIELALRTAWANLHKDAVKRRLLSTENEERVSHLLRGALNKLREMKTGGVKDYSSLVFTRPHVGAEFVTQDGKIKKPDIVFELCGWARPGVSDSLKDAIFVECKLLEHGSNKRSNKNVAAYCKAGVRRFVEGSYAERMREGMMVAYVRTSQALPDDLARKLGDEEMKRHLATDGKLTRCQLTRVDPRVYISTHERNWPYRDDPGGFPGPIAIRHLWLHA